MQHATCSLQHATCNIDAVSAQAFSHFTLEESAHELVVCDIQGVGGNLWTDPQAKRVPVRFRVSATCGRPRRLWLRPRGEARPARPGGADNVRSGALGAAE